MNFELPASDNEYHCRFPPALKASHDEVQVIEVMIKTGPGQPPLSSAALFPLSTLLGMGQGSDEESEDKGAL
jgi:hypothetical protein